METEDLFPKKYCFDSNEKKSSEEIKKEILLYNGSPQQNSFTNCFRG